MAPVETSSRPRDRTPRLRPSRSTATTPDRKSAPPPVGDAPRRPRRRMANVSSKPKFSGMKYRVVNTLGNGAGSTILLISDKTAGGKRYALKVVRRQDEEDDIYINQARVEHEAAQKLNHPAIAKIYDIRTKRSWFRVAGVELLMEYVDGKTLDELEAPEMGQLVLVFNQVASALTHM